MANPALRRRQLARTCKKYGLLIQPNALPILIEEMESRDHGNIDGGSTTFGDFLTVLQTKLSRSSSASTANLVTLDLVERVLLEEQQEQQQQQAQLLAAKAKQDAKLKKRKQQQQKILIQNEQDDEEEEIDETSSNNNNYNSLVAVSSKSKLKSSTLVPSVSRSSNSSSRSSNITNNKKSKLWKVISAFETPKLVYDSMRKQFRYEQGSASSSLMGSSQDIMTMRIQRYELVKQKVDRSRQEQRLSYLTTIDRLLGTKNNHTQLFNNNSTSSSSASELSLLGMLKSNPSLRCLELEDPTGCVPLRIDLLLDNDNNDNNDIIGCDVDTTGIYLEGSMVLVKGNHEESTLLTTNSEDNDGTVFRCTSIELAPIEVKSITKLHLPPSPYSYDDDFNNSGGGRSQSNSSSPLPIYSLSNLSLDDPDCIDRLEFVIDRMVQGNKKKRSSSSMEIVDDEDQEDENNVPDSILVLFGDFCTESTTSSQALDELASVLQDKNIPSKHSILLIPGPNDVGSNACWPLPAWNKKNIPSSMHPFLAASNSNTSNISTKRMRDNNNNASSLKGGNVYLCSNPCRLECADGRQVVLLRKDLIRESLQHQVLADADSIAYSNAKAASARGSSRASSQSQSHPSSPSLTSRIIHHALSQGHLSPSSSSQQAASTSCAPIYWNYDHSMTLYPLPDLMIVGLDPEYLDTGFDNNTESEVGSRNVGCRVVSPASKPSQNEWECSLTILRSIGVLKKLKA
ncbi:DNA_pol_E_B-domain-containing protein [Fragilariopsis cylindrus CCMP1102]|uniref:DNA polymerase II subunit 2 n=1 Tax=Fragilariopsis cylindrus CCMP1102 TaxID=635003 RepID=A0A1E7FTJ6_9STRA|nr:DNA_pol_E_B-domain-containing protein [Fragilariopsis cylindrus CCMP1102]|eukprot:OEU21492.1 DNA_pol_E_B-domain-containing protein [Fragilariopsis cylindrus CCMP1102]